MKNTLTLTMIGPPSAPGRPTSIETTPTSILLHWTPPQTDGNCKITNYKLEQKTTSTWTQVNSDFQIKDTNFNVVALETGCHYRFRVGGENSEGCGFWSEESEEIIVEKKVEELGFLEELEDRVFLLGDELELVGVFKGGDGKEGVWW